MGDPPALRRTHLGRLLLSQTENRGPCEQEGSPVLKEAEGVLGTGNGKSSAGSLVLPTGAGNGSSGTPAGYRYLAFAY